MKLLAGNSNRALAEAVASRLDLPLTRAQVKRFADNEVWVTIDENVRGEDVFILQSTNYPANDNLMELLVCIDALKRASARRITAVMPYFGYARQDRKTGGRTPISAKLVANLIERAGADRVLTMDLHSGQIQGFFDIPTDNLISAPLLATEKQVLAAVDSAVTEENARWGVNTLSASTKLIGDRPGGRTAADTLIVEAAVRANTAFGRKTLLAGASTDANVPMALGIPAIVIGGGGKTGGFHALSEWIDLTDAWKGAQTSLVTVLGLVGMQGVSAPLLEKRPPRTK